MNAEDFEKTLKKRIKPGRCRESLIGSDHLSDVTFILGAKGEDLKAHKMFLMTSSLFFHELFHHIKSDRLPLEVKFPSLSKAAMTEICRFAYCESVNFNQHNMLDILAAARKFNMDHLVEKTINYIVKEGLNENSVFKILEANQKYYDMVINMKCMQFINRNHQKCFKSAEFKHITLVLFRKVLEACKVPEAAAMEAIALWTNHSDSSYEESEALIGLVSKNTSGENVNQLDTESEPETECRSVKSEETSSDESVQIIEDQSRTSLDQNKKQPNSNQQLQQARYFYKPLNQFPSKCPKNLSFEGRQSIKRTKYANLNLLTGSKSILIKELRFLYDLNNKEFQIAIQDITNTPGDILFFGQAVTKENGKCMFYELPQPCEVAAGRKIWIAIQFAGRAYHLSFETFTVANTSTPDDLKLNTNEGNMPQVQIIWFIGYNVIN